MMKAQAMGQTMKVRSGLGEGLGVATRLRKPSDPMELHDWIAQEMTPLNEAWSVIWLRGDQETIQLANALLDACGQLHSWVWGLSRGHAEAARRHEHRRAGRGERS
ncbi:MAG: hypothetical protein ACRDNZ_22830 [Streptosporangiaceae bacterium]